MKALHLKRLLSRCFRTFFSFHKLQLYSYIGKFLYIYVIDIKVNKKTQPVLPTRPHHRVSCISRNVRPPVYEDPPLFET